MKTIKKLPEVIWHHSGMSLIINYNTKQISNQCENVRIAKDPRISIPHKGKHVKTLPSFVLKNVEIYMGQRYKGQYEAAHKTYIPISPIGNL